MTWDYPQPFTLEVSATATDIDGLNHTNNGVYVQWCERVAWAHSQALGLGIADYQRLDRAMVIKQGVYDYLQPSFLDEPLVLGTWLVGSDGKLSMERCFQLLRQKDQVTLMRGRWQLVCVDISGGRVRRMPVEFCEAYLPAVVHVNTPLRERV